MDGNISAGRIVVTEDDEDMGLLDRLLLPDDSDTAAVLLPPSPPPSPLPASPPRPRPILAQEDEDEEFWIVPPPARRGDYINALPSLLSRSLPSRSILKKTSSYDCDVPLDLDCSLASGMSKRTRQSSFLSQETSISISMSSVTISCHEAFFGCDSSAHPEIRRRVSFSSVDVREYGQTVGDNPSCRSGCPISLDWSYSKKYNSKCLNEFEAEGGLSSSTSTRRLRSQLCMNKWERRNVLAHGYGHTFEEMWEARCATRRARRRRSATRAMLPLLRTQEALLGIGDYCISKLPKSKSSEKGKEHGGGRGGLLDSDDYKEVLSIEESTQDTTGSYLIGCHNNDATRLNLSFKQEPIREPGHEQEY